MSSPNSTQHPLIQVQSVQKQFGAISILKSISFTVYTGEFLTLLGPSGCGKTTLLRLISGFETPDSGQILLDNKPYHDLPPQKRDVHTVFQSYALFPHLNVFENVAFALRCQKRPEQEIKSRVQEALKLVQLDAFLHRDTKLLSGGQQQRVAIARAIVNRPKVLLLDEPLSSLDYRLRKKMQYELKQLQKTLGITFVFVTHDQQEALSMSDRIIVFNQGKIEQVGTPREVYETPNNLHVAQFIGEANIFNVSVQSTFESSLTVEIEKQSIQCDNSGAHNIGTRLHLIIRPEDIRVWHQNEVSETIDMLPGIIQEIIYKGSTVDLSVKLPSGKVIYASEFFDEDDNDLDYEIGEPVWIQWYTGWEVLLPYEH